LILTFYADGQIAAIACGSAPWAIASVNHLILVTNNVSDYATFENLTVENWFTA
jgi:tRNA(fMet)-specific endonuclease VapC